MKKLLYIGNKLSQHGNTTTSIETLGGFLEDEDYTVFYASSKKNQIVRLLDMVFSTLKYSKTVDFVLIDVYSTRNFWYAFIISQLCRILKLRYIPKLHGGDLPRRLTNSSFFSRLIFDNAYINTAPSHYLIDSFTKFGYKNIVYIPNAIEIDSYNFVAREVSIPKLLWVRSFSEIYNPKMAITVLSLLKETYPQAELCMIGPDKENMVDDCKKYASELNVAVTFMGKLSKKDWAKVSEDYTIFINTTHYDNTPVSVIEAMALGLPVVSTNVGGVSYLINDGTHGLLVADADVNGMCQAIKRIISDSNLKNSLVLNARELVEKFDWKSIKNKWHDVLK